MIYFLYQQLAEFLDPESGISSFVNVFRYVTFRAGAACVTGFLLSVIFGGRVIRALISLKVGQPIRSAEEVHQLNELHGGKAGTPTMGRNPFPGSHCRLGNSLDAAERALCLGDPRCDCESWWFGRLR